MKELGVLDEAQLRAEFKAAYKELGTAACLQIMYELIISANLMAAILLEESNK